MPELISRICRSAGAGVLLLDNPCNLLAGPHDPAVAVRVVDDGGDDGRGGAGRSVAIDERLQRLRRSSGTSPDSRTSVPVWPCERGFGRQQRVRRPELWLLHHKGEARAAPPAPPSALPPDGRRRRSWSRARGARRSASTCSIIGSPATRWSTFGRADFMRVPLPAARMTT